MATTTTDANGNTVYIIDPNGNEITKSGKIIAASLLITVIIATLVVIIAHWPDRMPPLNSSTKYQYKWFDITYIDSKKDTTVAKTVPQKDSIVKRNSVIKTSSGKDSAITITDTIRADAKKPVSKDRDGNIASVDQGNMCRIDLNTLLLLLVALSGFLGNLIHVAGSFSNFIGEGDFKRRWALWYFINPFKATALSVGVYIIFRAGFLNSTDATASVSLYGVVAIAFLSGLFTEKATDKLRDVFAVVFTTSTAKSDPIIPIIPKVTTTVASITPTNLALNVPTTITIAGTGLDAAGITVKVGNTAIPNAGLTKTPTSISFSHTAAAAGNLAIVVADNKGTVLKSQPVIVA